ncbi:MAG: hypothetical protein PSV36_01665 [Algoriphagus sp.]|nr:hypothetical protein [Algoriphagus sp.]
MENTDSILNEYDKRKSDYQSVGEEIKFLLEKALKKSSLKYLPILERLKDRKSLERKIQGKEYQNLLELTDIYGIRVVVFQNKDIDSVTEIIKENFNFDEKNSEDKRLKTPTEFGYNSVHSIVSLLLNQNRNVNSEIKVEIQVRTVLQHAWAEFSHELGYKNPNNVPSEFLRSINRISALLEVGDTEFERLKSENKKYIRKIGKDIREGNKVEINQPSLKSFLNNNEYLNKAISGLKKDYNIRFVDTNANYTEIIDRLELLGVMDLNYLEKFLEKNSSHFFKFVKLFFEKRTKISKVTTLASNSPLFYLCHFMAATKGSHFFQNSYYSYSKYQIITPINLFDVFEESK